MTQKHPLEVLVAAFGIVISTAIAVAASRAGAFAFAAPLLLAGSLIASDMLRSRRRGASLRPSVTAIVLALAILAACGFVIYSNPSLVVIVLPIVGAGSAIVLNRLARAR